MTYNISMERERISKQHRRRHETAEEQEVQEPKPQKAAKQLGKKAVEKAEEIDKEVDEALKDNIDYLENTNDHARPEYPITHHYRVKE